MGRKFVNVDRETPLLLPVDMREWVKEDDLAHLVLEAVEEINLEDAAVNERGTGSEQYPPGMMAALLIYAYSRGLYSSRKIEEATYRDVGLRYLAADTHPDHDTIATFRRRNGKLLDRVYVQVLLLAQQVGMRRVGTVVVDGTKLAANASRRANLNQAQLDELTKRLAREVKERLAKAEQADREDDGGDRLPPELCDRNKLREKIREAKEVLRRREEEQKKPAAQSALVNLTDPDSRVQRTPKGYEQGYNAQLAVETQSGLIVGAHVCTDNQDRNQLVPTVKAVPTEAGPVHTLVADTGYDNSQAIAQLQAEGIEVFVPPQEPVEAKTRQTRKQAAVNQERRGRRDKVNTPRGQHLMFLRKTTIEPIFGVLKAAWGFTRFRLRGLAGVNIEWKLVCTAFNLRRIHRWMQLQPA